MLLNNVLLAGIGALVFYFMNEQQRWYYLDNTQYLLIFAALALGLALVEKFTGITAQKTLSEFATKLNLIDNEKVEEAVGDDHGKQTVPCYGTPFKVIRTQYGDRGLLAGYNEHVEAYQQGGLNQPPPGERIYKECMDDVDAIKQEEESV